MTVKKESLYEIINNNGITVVNSAISKNLSRVKCSHIATFINTFGRFLIGKCTD